MNPGISPEEEIEALKKRVALLQSDLDDMQMILDTTVEHGTTLENELMNLIDQLSQVSRDIEQGEFDAQVLSDLVDRPDELGQLGRMFMTMGYEVSAREKRLRMLRVVIPAGVALIAEKDFNRLLETIVVEAQQLCNADGASLLLLKQNELEYIIISNRKLGMMMGGSSGNTPNFARVPLYDAENRPNLHHTAVRVALSANRFIINDIYGTQPTDLNLESIKEFDRQHNYHSQSMLAIPLTDTDNKVVGVLQLVNARDNNDQIIPFHPDDVLESLIMLGSAGLVSYWREEKLRAEIAQLRIEINQTLKAKQVSEITDTDYFKDLQTRASELRNTRVRRD